MVDSRYLKDFVAGSASGCSAVLVSQPIDVVRVRVQTNTSQASALHCARAMFVREGPRSFYKGTLPPMSGVGFLMSIVFSSQQQMRRCLAVEGRPFRIQDSALCGAFGGLCQAPAANVVELLKVRLQVQKDIARPLGMREMFGEVWQSGGIRAFSRGLLPIAARDFFGYAIFFGVGDTLVTQCIPEGGTKKDVHLLNVAMIGMLGGVLYWLPSMPFDTIKSRLHADSLQAPKYSGTLDCLTKSVRCSGFPGLYRGLLLSCLMACPKNAAKLPVFHLVQGLLCNDAEPAPYKESSR